MTATARAAGVLAGAGLLVALAFLPCTCGGIRRSRKLIAGCLSG